MLNLSSTFSVIDSHTAGHPTRTIVSGIPALCGTSVLERRADFQARFDHLRGALLHEPRGHAAMVGLVPVPSEAADYGAFFISSYVYLDMCGHGTIGYAKTLAATGQITSQGGGSFTLETPAGIVTVGLVWAENGRLDSVRLRNVPSYIGIASLPVPFEPFGTVPIDIVYGGMWYALVDATRMGLSLVPDQTSELLRIGSALKLAIKAEIAGRPEFAGAVPPSVLFYADEGVGSAVHFLVLESNKFDRSPCGTGTAARVAQLAAGDALGPDGTYRARNILGVDFLARLVDHTAAGHAVAEIEGTAYLTAFSTIVIEQDDALRGGFLCR